MRFIDTHVHFWNQALMPYDWLHEVAAIAHAHTPKTLAAEAGENHPARIVFVECGAPWLDEVKWIEQLAATEPRIVGIVAKTVVDAGAPTTAAIAELKTHSLVRSVRHMIQGQADPDFCLRPAFVAGVRELGNAGLSFDLCCKHHQMASVVELVRRCPETRFILDHAGKPDIRGGLLDPWRARIRSLAALPNVDCKLSGLITEADWAAWTTADLHPYVLHLLETFGPGRLLFGGDWPVAKLAGSYLRWLDTARGLVSHLSTAEQSAIFHDNARRVYRFARPPVPP